MRTGMSTARKMTPIGTRLGYEYWALGEVPKQIFPEVPMLDWPADLFSRADTMADEAVISRQGLTGAGPIPGNAGAAETRSMP